MGTLEGLNDAIKKIQTAVDKMEHGSAQGLADALLFVGTESQNKAPVELGDLRGSLSVEIDGSQYAQGIKGGGISVKGDIPDNALSGSVSYNTPYAAAQHEHTEYNHPLGGQAKYLESVLTSEQDRILQLIGGAVLNDLEVI